MLGPVRQEAYGIARTYAAGPGAPAWAGESAEDFVLRLPIPKDLTTLSFDPREPRIAAAISKAIADAHDVASTNLPLLLSRPVIGGNPRPPIEAVRAPEVAPSRARGDGPALPLRLSLVALIPTGIVFLVATLLPEPLWHRYDVNVRICSQPLQDPFAPCAAPTEQSAYATVLFGPASAGRTTQAAVFLDGRTIEQSPAVVNTSAGRILNYEIDWERLCGTGDCIVRVRASVDGESVFSAQIERRVDLDMQRG